jgi:hypothetical protein
LATARDRSLAIGIPDPRNLHLPREPLARGDAAQDGGDYLQEFADTWSTRGVRAWHEGWWEVGRETGNLLAPILGVPTNTISMHQNVTVARGSSRRASPTTARGGRS